MATLAIKGSVTRCEDIAKLFTSLGAREFLCELTDEKLLYYKDDDKRVISIPDQPDNIYRNLLFDVYTLEEFEEKFPYRVDDKVTYDVYYSVEEPCKKVTSSIARLFWDASQNEVIYIMDNGKKRGTWQLRMPEPKFEPKDGDVFCIDSLHPCVGIVKELLHSYGEPDKDRLYFSVGYWKQSGNMQFGTFCACNRNTEPNYRQATEEEKKKLFDKLKEEGYEWDADAKELVKLKWKPKYKEPYFSPFFSNVDFLFSTCSHIYTEHFSDELTIKQTSVFKTEQECQEFCNRLNNAINSVSHERSL